MIDPEISRELNYITKKLNDQKKEIDDLRKRIEYMKTVVNEQANEINAQKMQLTSLKVKYDLGGIWLMWTIILYGAICLLIYIILSGLLSTVLNETGCYPLVQLIYVLFFSLTYLYIVLVYFTSKYGAIEILK